MDAIRPGGALLVLGWNLCVDQTGLCMSDIFIVVFDLLFQSIHLIPLIAFQSTAIVGLLAAVLVMTRRPGQPAHWQSLHMGLMLGLAGYTTSWFVADYMVGPVKLNLMVDVLLLGGWLGGWRGGCICYGLLMAARWQFGGEENLVGWMVDAWMPLLGGWVCRYAWSPQDRRQFPAWLAWALWLVRQICAALGLGLGLVVGGCACWASFAMGRKGPPKLAPG